MLVDTRVLAKIKKRRAGVIPYTKIYNRLYFLLAQDRKTGDLGDFGGGCKKNENTLTTAIREFKEESNGIFPALYKTEVYLNTFALANKNMSIIFLPVAPAWFWLAPDKFKNKRNNEVIDIKWVAEEAFTNIIYQKNKLYGYRVWSKIKNFFTQLVEPSQLYIILKEAYSVPEKELPNNNNLVEPITA